MGMRRSMVAAMAAAVALSGAGGRAIEIPRLPSGPRVGPRRYKDSPPKKNRALKRIRGRMA